ncbi:hypothetical protein OKA04_14755 [Luteolibacter flavescens]|uniref:Uncharacterized protein n=1 Tax=Luteolibacter flavescens TaxID=1859460 RepID=A0ABT3FRB6_9BACT|nr:hypothetical protein [Luteolibacter flavescens]MCW1885997.1 hypothetical protein [Luteolibacter flavescens]
MKDHPGDGIGCHDKCMMNSKRKEEYAERLKKAQDLFQEEIHKRKVRGRDEKEDRLATMKSALKWQRVEDRVRRWIYDHLLDFEDTKFETLGEKRVIFSNLHKVRWAVALIDLPPVPEIQWRRLEGMTAAESFFAGLRPLLECQGAIRFELYRSGGGSGLYVENMRRWSGDAWTPSGFLNFRCEGWIGESVFHILLIGKERAALVDAASPGLEISFYGPDDLWEGVKDALGLPER